MKLVKESLEFDFSNQPLDRYKSKGGVSKPPQYNNRKLKQGLNNIEEEQLDILKTKLYKVSDEYDSLKDELRAIDDYGNDYNSEELEEENFYSYILNKYGEEMLDVLNSGISYKDKLDYARRKSTQANDTGEKSDEEYLLDEFEQFMTNKLKREEDTEQNRKKIPKLKNLIKEKEKQIDALENKIYNLENY